MTSIIILGIVIGTWQLAKAFEAIQRSLKRATLERFGKKFVTYCDAYDHVRANGGAWSNLEIEFFEGTWYVLPE